MAAFSSAFADFAPATGPSRRIDVSINQPYENDDLQKLLTMYVILPKKRQKTGGASSNGVVVVPLRGGGIGYPKHDPK